MCRPRARLLDVRQYIIAMTRYLKKRCPHRKACRNQKISDAEFMAVGLARIRFIFPPLPQQPYLRIIRLRYTIEELNKRNDCRALVIVDYRGQVHQTRLMPFCWRY